MTDPWHQHPDRPCAHRPADDYFPTDRIARKEAANLCGGCPVLGACLSYAGVYGVWGGTTEHQRAEMGGELPANRAHNFNRVRTKPPLKIRSRYDIPPCGTESAYQRHASLGDTRTDTRKVTCEPCLEAHRTVVAVRAARKKKAS